MGKRPLRKRQLGIKIANGSHRESACNLLECVTVYVRLTADAVVKLVSVSLTDGSTLPATTSSEPSKYLSKRFWVISVTEASGNWTVTLVNRGEET